MTFAELKEELAARGFNDLSDTRQGRYINNARAELDGRALWPWREDSVTGTAPLTVSDLGPIEAVTNETGDYRLRAAQYADLLDWYGDLSTTGSPTFYYRAHVNGSPVVATYPVTTDTVGVQHWHISPDLSASGDEPESPDEAHLLIVDMAVQRAYRDKHNHEAANALQAEIDRRLFALLQNHPPGIADDEGIIVGGSDWHW